MENIQKIINTGLLQLPSDERGFNHSQICGAMSISAVLCLVASGMGQAGQQTPPVGADAALFYSYALASMRQLLEACLYGLKTSTPRSAPAGAGSGGVASFALDGAPGTLGSSDVRDRLVQPGGNMYSVCSTGDHVKTMFPRQTGGICGTQY
jgi:hypothetical protein